MHRSVARNVTGDSERPAPGAVSFPIANGTAEPPRAVPHPRPKERPRSTGSQLEAVKSADMKRSSSIRLEDISGPRLQSSTNFRVASRNDEAAAKLQPTRAAPAPPNEQPNKPPQRPPPPCPASRDVPAAANQYEEIALRSPTGPPPAPPDSRHRFYSSQVPRRPEQPDGVPVVSVSSMRSKFEPVRSSSPSTGPLNAPQRQTKRDVKNCPSVPTKSPAAPVTRPLHPSARPSPGINESQC